MSQHGRTSHKKRRVNSFATEQDSLLEMTVASEVSNVPTAQVLSQNTPRDYRNAVDSIFTADKSKILFKNRTIN